MTIDRRKVLAGLSGLAATAASPAWAQFGSAIQPQNDPWAQVDPYADPRNGHPSQAAPRAGAGRSAQPNGAFDPQSHGFANVSPAEEELEIGRASSSMRKLLQEMGGPYPNQRVQEAMTRFMQPFVRVCDRPSLPWEVVVNRVAQFQALAFGGGKMIIYPHVINVSDHPGELAAILVHEMGHNVFSHSTKKNESAIMLDDAMETGTGAKMKKDLGVMGIGAKDVLLKSYGRDNEYEADSYIITLFERVGVHPRYAISSYEKMMKYYGQRPHEDNSLFSTHPGTLDRMRRMAEIIRTLPPPGREVELLGWATLKATFPTPAEFRNA